MKMRRGVMLVICLGLVTAALAGTLRFYRGKSTPVVVPVVTGPAWTLVLDAGHGGEDGGAVSISGEPESRINLAIVEKLRDVLAFYGVSPVVLREEDRSLHDPAATTLREKKVSDLKNRVASVQGLEDAVLISIHQNSYPERIYRGGQVFYAPTEGSQSLAQIVQLALHTYLQPDNTRDVKPIPDTVYLMNHVTCPAILVECGFLTNPEEDLLLQQAPYQRRLASVLAAAWLTWSG